MDNNLALKMRPNKLDDIIGQEHLIGENKIISNLVKNHKLFSMILYGKPGTGKTSLANAIVQQLGLKYRTLNAVINNKKDFDIVVEEAKMYHGLVLIMDEIHRLNKDKQDLLLPVLESGLITLIGLTTSNPYHSINPAIRSRCQIFELYPLSDNEVRKGLNQIIKYQILDQIKIDEDACTAIIYLANGDLRFAYNLLEVAYYSTNDQHITLDVITKINNKKNTFIDKNEDGYYDLLSAFQKSIRGSDVNASIHYLARLIESGDFDSIYRRMSVIAYEDIGLANPTIGPKVDSAINLSERLGMPECQIVLANVVIEMALSPKSNSAYMAINLAMEDLAKGHINNVPEHIKNNSREYKYPHDYPNSFVKQQYLPDNLINRQYYNPKNNKHEQLLATIYNNLKEQ